MHIYKNIYAVPRGKSLHFYTYISIYLVVQGVVIVTFAYVLTVYLN
jgi:hypothetical protein